jgi:SAM-dependent methyltransferase
MSTTHPVGFTAHNVRLDDGTFTFPQVATIDRMGNYQCVKNLLPLLYPKGWAGRSVVDLGCLEGGYATEFARLGLEATGIDVRESNIANAQYIKSKTNLPNLRFIRDDAWNLGRYGPFDIVFCVGLHYHIEDQRRFMHEMSRACRKAIFIDTHVAPELDHEPAVALHSLSGLTTHEGLPGRWYPEHDLDVATAKQDLEQLKWASWENRRSFWPTKGGLAHAMRTAGFSVVMEDFDQLKSGEVWQLSPDGWGYRNCRAMFVGLKLEDGPEAAPFDVPDHALDGAPRRESLVEPAPKMTETAPAPEATPDEAYEALRSEAESLRAEVAALRDSTSWKLTAPLRALRRRLGT